MSIRIRCDNLGGKFSAVNSREFGKLYFIILNGKLNKLFEGLQSLSRVCLKEHSVSIRIRCDNLFNKFSAVNSREFGKLYFIILNGKLNKLFEGL